MYSATATTAHYCPGKKAQTPCSCYLTPCAFNFDTLFKISFNFKILRSIDLVRLIKLEKNFWGHTQKAFFCSFSNKPSASKLEKGKEWLSFGVGEWRWMATRYVQTAVLQVSLSSRVLIMCPFFVYGGGMTMCVPLDPSWASINRGVLLCNECCSVHRVMGTHISHIRSLSSTNWPPVLKEVSLQLSWLSV